MQDKRGALLLYGMTGLVLVILLFLCGGLGYLGYLIVRPAPTLPPLVFTTITPPPNLFTPEFVTTLTPASTLTPGVSLPGLPGGKIAYACMLDKERQLSQICLMNADGSAQRQLTNNPRANHYYPSLAPDGQSVVFSSNQYGSFDIFEVDLAGNQKQLTFNIGEAVAPEIAPDGRLIVFTLINKDKRNAVWVMERDGSNPHQLYGPPEADAWDPTWSPDGQKILFASRVNDAVQLLIINLDGTGLQQVTNMPNLRGRNDWSVNDEIVTYSGTPWTRELYLMSVDGSNLHQITPAGGNSQGPSFSTDGGWVTFTAYFDRPRDVNGCEIYIMRLDGTQLTRLTDNDYCDWQPRWGP
jgi:Tol biopolymer transport system component